MADILWYVLFFLLLVVVSAWLALTLYIVWKRRKYAHIPSPKMPRLDSTMVIPDLLATTPECVP